MLELSRWEKLAIGVMRQGHVPQHIAFIMDGNRRFGKNKLDKAMSGHQEGAYILKKCLLYCL
jgi:ditrans,polycis-polyprenyl diphosphate synthase